MSAILSLTLVGCSTTYLQSKGEELKCTKKDDMKKKIICYDIRDEASYKEGHLKHAIIFHYQK